MVIIEPAVPLKTKMAARSCKLGLGSRLFLGNMKRILNKDLTRFMQSLSRERQMKGSASKVTRWQPANKNEIIRILLKSSYSPDHFKTKQKRNRGSVIDALELMQAH